MHAMLNPMEHHSRQYSRAQGSPQVLANSQVRQSLPLSLLTRIEVYSGIIGATEYEFIELSMVQSAGNAETRHAYEVSTAAARTEIVGTLYLFCQYAIPSYHTLIIQHPAPTTNHPPPTTHHPPPTTHHPTTHSSPPI